MKKLSILAVLAMLMSLFSVVLGGGGAAASPDYTAWVDLGIIYSAPSGDAYYPSVIYDANGFGTASPPYKMWYSDGLGAVFVVSSSDGLSWGTPAPATGLGGDAHHVQVVYDANCFGVGPCDSSAVKYKIWYWDINADLYSISAIAYAESPDGIIWSNDQAITQGAPQLVTGGGFGWNRGSYGPVDVTYQPGASPSDYVMYYDGTDGSSEFTGLAYSSNGLAWTAYSGNPVLQGSATAAWDCSDDAYGTVYRDVNGYHFWYSGGGAGDGAGGCADRPVDQGIGYASSSDGKTWVKNANNPIFHINDGVGYRNSRTYTPAVVDDGSGILRMYYSAQATGGRKNIGLAVQPDTQGPITSNVLAIPNPAPVNSSLTLTAKVDDTTTGGSKIKSAEYNWDGTNWYSMNSSDETFDEVSEDVTQTFSAPATAGLYNLCVRGTDVIPNTGDSTCITLVAYDPSAGFVTAGGSVPSALGADLVNPTISGPATFGFVSKYVKSKTTPDGNLEFQFKAGALNFKSTSMEWLVVTGEPRAQFRGEGTINGTNICKFQADAWDASFQPGSVDAFGLKIFSCVSGGDRYALSATPLSQGSIIIHQK